MIGSVLRVDGIDNLDGNVEALVKDLAIKDEALLSLGAYASGITVDSYSTYVTLGDSKYRPLSSVVLPFETTDWATDESKFVSLGDVILRGSLGDSTDPALGAALIGRSAVKVDSIKDLLLQVQEGDKAFLVSSYHEGLGVGGGMFVWSATEDAANHDGVTVFDPLRPFPVDWTVKAQRDVWYSTAGTGVGCFVRAEVLHEVQMTKAGAKGDRVTDDSEAFTAAYSVNKRVEFDGGQFLLTKPNDDPNGFLLLSNTSLKCTRGGSVVRGKIGSGDATDLWCLFSASDHQSIDICDMDFDFDQSQGRAINLRRCLDVRVNRNKFREMYTTGRTVIGDAVQTVVLQSVQRFEFNFNFLYAGPSNYGAASLNYVSFGVRITTAFLYGDDPVTEFCQAGFVYGNHFIGPFTWNALEVAGTGTRNIDIRGNTFIDPVLTTIDLDKGCKKIVFDSNTIVRPRKGIWPMAGGDSFIGINVQGLWGDGLVTAFTEDVQITNNTIYDNGVTDPLASPETLFCSVVRAKRVTISGNRSVNSAWRTGIRIGSSEDVIFKDNEAKVYDLLGPDSSDTARVLIEGNNIQTFRSALITNATYQMIGVTKVKIMRNNFMFVGASNSGLNGVTIDNVTGQYLIVGNTLEGYSRGLSMNATGSVTGYLKDNMSVNCSNANVYATMSNSGNVETTL